MWNTDSQKAQETALVLLFRDRRESMWDSEVSELVGEVEERLDGVFVTYALEAATQPSLDDALAAARFMGCSEAFVAVVGEAPNAVFAPPRLAGGARLSGSVAVDESAEAIASAFMLAMTADDVAACA